jgi:DNA-directed RNA polymerase specialized sigma subunit
MEEKLKNWIKRYQSEGDEEALQHLRETCWPIVERLILELTKEKEPEIEDRLRQKGIERFPFILSKYQLEVQLPMETFLRNTYRFYFQQVLKGQV